MKWLRLYHDTVTDPKWRLVAIDSGQPLSAVLAVWMSMLVNASEAKERGTLEGWDDRIAGAGIDLRGDAVRSIREAMQGLVLDGDRLTGWDKRQRASDNVAERVKRHRSGIDPTPPGNGVDRDRDGASPLHGSNVTLHPASVTGNPLRAQTPDTDLEKKEGGELSGARARSLPTDAEFDEFYRAFPLHKARGAALRAYRAAVKKAPHAEIMEGVLRYQRECEGVAEKWIKHPATWLNGECWADEPDNRVNGGNNGQQRHPTSGRKSNGAGSGGSAAARRRGILDGLSKPRLDTCGAFAYG